MKRIFNIISILAVLISGVVFTSCDDNDGGATPVVRFVRSCDPNYAEKLLTEVSMGSTIAIIGYNLEDVCAIEFNDQSAKLNPTLITGTSIIVDVPGTMPSVVTNKMYLTTKGGKTAEYDFSVIIPSPTVSSISCEWAPAGDEVTISGNYFFAQEDGSIGVTFPGGLTAEVVSFTDTEITCVVPDGATIEGSVSVTSAYGTSRSTFTWRNSEGIFIDCEDTSWNWWGYGSFASDGGIDGQYLYLSGSVSSWGWPDGALWLLYFSNTGEPLVSEGEVSEYSLCFEYYCTKWDCVPMIMLFDTTGAASVDGDEAQYHWKLYEEDYTANKWTTKTIPLTDFNVNKEETTTERSIGSLDELVNFLMMPFGAADDSGRLEMRIDNVRLVRTE